MTNHKVSMIEKVNEEDKISDLPDSVLLRIMSFMDTRDAIQTCVLSKRWKDLCKCLTNLTFNDRYRWEIYSRKFVSWVLSSRNHSHSLLDLAIISPIDAEVLDKIVKYALFLHVHKLTLNINLIGASNFDTLPLIFCCESLTSLKLCIVQDHPSMIVLPKSLHLPSLKTLQLECITFVATDNQSAEPFTNCLVLDTLYLQNCSLHDDAQVLCISNSSLSILKIHGCNIYTDRIAYNIALSTPNLRSFTIRGIVDYQLSSACNLSLLGPVSIGMFMVTSSIIIRWLQGLASVKTLTLTSITLQIILDDLSTGSIFIQPPCFVRLETLRVKRKLSNLSEGQMKRVVGYLLQNTPEARVDIICD